LPFGGGKFGVVGIDKPELAHIRKILDRSVNTNHLRCFERINPTHIFIEVVALPLVNRNRQSVWFASVQSGKQSFF